MARSPSMAVAKFGSTNSVMSQGGVPGGGVVRLIKSIPSVEVKSALNAITVVGTAGNFVQFDNGDLLSSIVQGTEPYQRIGRKIRVIGIIVRMDFQVPPGPWTFDLVRDKQCNGITATTSLVYSDPTKWSTPPNNLYEERFQFMKRTENLNSSQEPFGASGNFTTVGISYQKKCNFVVEYAASTGATADLVSDNLLFFGCNGNASGPISPSNKGFIRFLYVDD